MRCVIPLLAVLSLAAAPAPKPRPSRADMLAAELVGEWQGNRSDHEGRAPTTTAAPRYELPRCSGTVPAYEMRRAGSPTWCCGHLHVEATPSPSATTPPGKPADFEGREGHVHRHYTRKKPQ
jgi:hypothetical protein